VNNIEFGPTSSGKRYLSLGYHRCNRAVPPKRCWSISRDLEFGVFCWADGFDVSDADGDMWGFFLREGELEVLGTDRERIAKFPCPTNETEHWHGYPVHAADRPERRPSPVFIENLYRRSLLSKVQKKRIQESRI